MTPAADPTPKSESLAEPSLLDVLVPSPRPLAARIHGPVIGECRNDRHPVLLGRYLVSYPNADGQDVERWLAALHGLAVRCSDRVLLVQPENWPEPVVTGVLDGFAHRPVPVAAEAARIQLKPDELVRIESERGSPLIEVRQGQAGPVVRFLTEDVRLDLPGDLEIAARNLKFDAKLGGVSIRATDDVIVTGENVKLN